MSNELVDMARTHTAVASGIFERKKLAHPNRRSLLPNGPGVGRTEPHSEGLGRQISWEVGSSGSARADTQENSHPMPASLEDAELWEPPRVLQIRGRAGGFHQAEDR